MSDGETAVNAFTWYLWFHVLDHGISQAASDMVSPNAS
jgi:hypothetical protein